MRKKFLVIICLFVLFMFIDVKAITCEYLGNDIKVRLESDSNSWTVSSGGSYSVTTYDNSIKTTPGRCPSTIYYKCSGNTCYIADNTSSSSFPTYANGKSGQISKSNSNGGSGGGSSSGSGLSQIFGNNNPDCQTMFGDLLDFLDKNVFKVIYFLVPIVLVILTTIDFAKAVFADEKDGMKKATGNFAKRAVAALLIFLSPTIVAIVLSLLNVASC